MARRVEVKVIAPKLGDVDQTIDVEPVEHDEDSKACNARNRAGELFTDPILHVVTLEPLQYIARRVIRAAYLGRDPGDVSTIEDEGSIEEARGAWAQMQAEVAPSGG